MASFLDNCDFNATSTGTGDFVVTTALTGHQTPALAGATNTKLYKYYARSSDLSQWEIGEGAYTVSSTTLARTTVISNSAGTGTGTGQSGAGTKISFSTVPLVAVVGLKEDLISVEEANSFTTAQKTQAQTNIGVSAGATLEATPANPTATTSTTGVMMGLGSTCKLTPTFSTRVKIEFIGNAQSSGAAGFCIMKVYFGTSTAPANAAAITGTQVGASVQTNSPSSANIPDNFFNGGIITGLTAGTAYWFDLSAAGNGGNSATLTNISFNAYEF